MTAISGGTKRGKVAGGVVLLLLLLASNYVERTPKNLVSSSSPTAESAQNSAGKSENNTTASPLEAAETYCVSTLLAGGGNDALALTEMNKAESETASLARFYDAGDVTRTGLTAGRKVLDGMMALTLPVSASTNPFELCSNALSGWSPHRVQ